MFRMVLLGAPASGKGTISKRIVEHYAFEHISPGDMLRLNVLKKTELGNIVKSYMDRGELVPDEIINKMIFSRLEEIKNNSWLLDGFPRTLHQAEELHKLYKLNAVLALHVPHDVIIERVKNRWIHLPSGRVYNKGFNDPKVAGKDDITNEDLVQRDDDKPEVLKHRLQEYDNDILKPLSDFYTKAGLLKIFRGRTTAEIWPQIQNFLKEQALHTQSN